MAPCLSLSSTQVGRRSPPSTRAAELPESLPIGVCHGIRQVVPSLISAHAGRPADVLPPSGALLQCTAVWTRSDTPARARACSPHARCTLNHWRQGRRTPARRGRAAAAHRQLPPRFGCAVGSWPSAAGRRRFRAHDPPRPGPCRSQRCRAGSCCRAARPAWPWRAVHRGRRERARSPSAPVLSSTGEGSAGAAFYCYQYATWQCDLTRIDHIVKRNKNKPWWAAPACVRGAH